MRTNTTAAQLYFCTVRIVVEKVDGKIETGTGFLFDAARPWDPSGHLPLVVSNKHVLVKSAKSLTIEFLRANPDRSAPEPNTIVGYSVSGPALTEVVEHPDPAVDVAVIPFAELVRKMNNEWPYIKALNWSLLPSPETFAGLDAIEDLTFVGYPDGRRDPVTLTPVVRQAISSTPIGWDWDSKPAFLVDGSVFGGSSGSPVFVFNRGPWKDSEGNTNLGVERLLLVGIVASTHIRSQMLPVEDAVSLLRRLTTSSPAPDILATTQVVGLAQELNLGIAFSAEAIADTLNLFLEAQGLPTQTGTGQ